MPVPIAPEVRAMIRHEFELGHTNDEILPAYDISVSTLNRMRRNWKEFDLLYIPKEAPIGRPRSISEAHQEELLIYLDSRPIAYLDKMAWFLFNEFELIVDETTIWRCLHRLGWSRKNMRRIAKQRNQDLRNRWMVRLTGWRASQLIFLDESAACERTGG